MKNFIRRLTKESNFDSYKSGNNVEVSECQET